MSSEPTQITATVTPPAVIPDMTMPKLAKLAREIAINIRKLPDILRDYSLTPAQFAEVEKLPFFKRAVEHLTIEWNSAMSTQDRIKYQSAAALEENLINLATRMASDKETLTAAVETGKFFAKLSGIGEGKAEGNSADKFVITINLGADQTLTFEKSAAPLTPKEAAGAIPDVIEGRAEPPTVFHIPERKEDAPPLLAKPEGAGEEAAV